VGERRQISSTSGCAFLERIRFVGKSAFPFRPFSHPLALTTEKQLAIRHTTLRIETTHFFTSLPISLLPLERLEQGWNRLMVFE
jgi:hypothetical protein